MKGRRRILLFAGVGIFVAIPGWAQTADSPPGGPPAEPPPYTRFSGAPPLAPPPAAYRKPGGTPPDETSTTPATTQTTTPATTPATTQALSLPEAEKIAIENHPQIQIAQHRAGFAAGAYVSQYVTDFGRTQALVRSSGQHARAEEANVGASRADVLLQVHQAYFGAL